MVLLLASLEHLVSAVNGDTDVSNELHYRSAEREVAIARKRSSEGWSENGILAYIVSALHCHGRMC